MRTELLRPRVIFGEAPGPNTDPLRPLYPHLTTGAAAKLISLLGVDRQWYLDNTLRINTLHDGVSDLNLEEARSRVAEIILLVENNFFDYRFIALGAKALNCLPQEFRRLKPLEKLGPVLYVPHTSGANLWYNDPENYVSAALAAQEHFRDAEDFEAPEEAWVPRGGTGPGQTRKALYEAVMGLRAALPTGPLPPPPGREAVEIEWMLREWFHSGSCLKDKRLRKLKKEESLRALPVIQALMAEELLPAPALLDAARFISDHEPWLIAERGQTDVMKTAWLSWYARATTSKVAT